MKLRIPRRIKDEIESSDESESEPIEAASTGSKSLAQQDEILNSQVHATSKSVVFVTSDTGYTGLSVISAPPTRTTSTLTPTTLRNIEQTFQDLTNDSSQAAPYQAGFVPPLPAPISSHDQYMPSYQSQQAMIPAFLTEDANNSIDTLETSSSMSDSSIMDEVVSVSNGKGRPRTNYAPSTGANNNSTPPKRRNAGGRKPNKPSNLSPEEEEKRRVRRERNKQAAARCRRRREDHTHELQIQVDELEDKKRQLTNEIQQMNKMRDELCELIDEHKKSNQCNMPHRDDSPHELKPNVTYNGKISAIPSMTAAAIQRPTNFVTALSNNNNSNVLNANNNNNNNNNVNKLSLKIKAEPEDYYDDEPASKRRCNMLSGQEYDITTPTTPYVPQLNTPTFIPTKQSSHKPNRPSSLNVASNLKPSESLARKNVTDIAGVNVCTPSTGMFNFESLMDGGTGLTPVANPLIPCSTQNRNPLEMLNTPTSGSESKLVSL